MRPGGALYGLTAGPRTGVEISLKPALAWYATVVHLRDFRPGQTIGYGRAFRVTAPMRVATIACGYGDGYSRSYGPGGHVLVRGRRAPLVGRISMDSACVDVTRLGGIEPGEGAILIGRQGDEEIRAEDLAARVEIASYEVTCRITARVPRVYRETGR